MPLTPGPRPGQLLGDDCDCGGKRIVRKNRGTGELFISCTAYPQCRNTWPIDDFHEAGDFSWRKD